ncbi:TetR/AcrR family transcriptional regulator [Streptomyces griseofuscus]|uniref:TetR/AcrR family transcriptional regulator n=1 Tax=Streptomyces griseofuscus TaxID=146922 RepID=A0A7H1QBJ9_9ACTN|nr:MULTISPECIES: TetR/AcrR family transcriptional regulator [Streptomyces]MBA9043634.1 AcrR family transcriptional regulator [Streptomyces murinus]QNT97679.1 TetR/AcrR family transcriptional regulator [Streptomyces griseofuscus]
MPKIHAASVADHRAQQRAALLDAARELLAEGDASKVTFAAVARRTGLARNSVYKYFTDRRELLTEVVRQAAPRWTERIHAALAAAGDSPEERVAAYVTAQLEMVRDGEHRIARAGADAQDAAALREGADSAHRALLDPLVTTLRDLGDDAPLRTARLLQGLVNAATTALEGGDAYEAVTERAVRLAVAALGGVTATP